MTTPTMNTSGNTADTALAPARRTRSRFTSLAPAAPVVADFADAEVARGQSDAIFGALARMQLKLDVLAREHTDSLATIVSLLEQLNARLDDDGTV